MFHESLLYFIVGWIEQIFVWSFWLNKDFLLVEQTCGCHVLCVMYYVSYTLCHVLCEENFSVVIAILFGDKFFDLFWTFFLFVDKV